MMLRCERRRRRRSRHRRDAGGVRGKANVEFRPHGRRRLRNVNESLAVYRAVRKGEKSEELPIDPVFRMAMDPAPAVSSLTFEGVEYQFCSFECARAVSAAPADYTR